MATLNDIALAGGFTIQLPNPQDPYFNNVTLLLPGNGVNNGNNNTIIDSNGNITVGQPGGPVGQGTFSPFSLTGWSTYFNGTGAGLSIANNSTYNFGTNNFTIEFFTKFTNPPDGSSRVLLTKGYQNSIAPYLFTFYSNTLSIFMSSDGFNWNIANFVPIITGGDTNIWYHIALTRTGSVFRAFVNGVQATTFNSSAALYSSNQSIVLGTNGSVVTPQNFNGFISNLRMVNGTALYTTNFTPPTEPLTAVPGTVLLTCQQNRFMDSSNINAAVVPINSPRVQSVSPFNPIRPYSTELVGGSGEFNGVGRLSLPQQFFARGGFTTECWFYKGDDATQMHTLFSSNNSVGSYTTKMAIKNNNGIFVTLGNSNYINSGPISNLFSYQWNHIVFMKSFYLGSWCLTVYVNGTQIFNITSIPDDTNWISYVGGNDETTWGAKGYISGVKITSYAVYDAGSLTITVPSSPPTLAGNPLNLINFTNAQITDATSKNDVYTKSDVKISTDQSKWGGSSIYFDGNSDQLVVTGNPVLRLGRDNWTIEWWMNLTTIPGTTNLLMALQTPVGGVANSSFAWYLTGSPYWEFYANDGNTIMTNPRSFLVANVWQYWAVVRSGRSITVYINGEAKVTGNLPSASSILNGPDSANLYIGAEATYSIPGYLNDIRITKGIARYTSNFRIPRNAFPTY